MKALNLRKTSHFGTLDPRVTGVLPVALNRACKLTGFFIGEDKEYVGIMRFHTEVSLKDLNDLENNFRQQLEEHNKLKLTDDEFKSIRNHLDGGSLFVKAKKLRDKYELVRDEGIVYIEFINTKEWCKNIFQVTNQITNREGRY